MTIERLLLVGTFLYSLVAVCLLPIFACGLINCSGDRDGYKSISLLVHEGPLATSFSYFGGIFLWSVFGLQLQTEPLSLPRTVVALFAANSLSVPLVLPLGSVNSDYYHTSFAVVGAFLEMVVTVLLLVKKLRYMVCAGFLLQFSAFVIGCAGLWSSESGFRDVSLLVAEYIFGAGTIVVTVSSYRSEGS